MGSLLVVLTSDEPNEELFQTVVQHATGTDKEVLVCRIISEKNYKTTVEEHAESRKNVDSIEKVEINARDKAQEIAERHLEGDISHSPLGIVGNIPEDLLQISRNRDCDHIFATGKKRSPTGKAIFGDTAQSILLNFDGPVTVVTE